MERRQAWITVREAAAKLKVSVSYINQLCARGVIRSKFCEMSDGVGAVRFMRVVPRKVKLPKAVR